MVHMFDLCVFVKIKLKYVVNFNEPLKQIPRNVNFPEKQQHRQDNSLLDKSLGFTVIGKNIMNTFNSKAFNRL